MSIARHHAEWLSLLEISGSFLSMPVLLQAFPQGLDAHDPQAAGELRAAYEEWADNQGGLAPDPAIHTAWVRYVLQNTLEMPDEVLAEGQAIPEGIKVVLPEHGEVIRPDLMLVEPPSLDSPYEGGSVESSPRGTAGASRPMGGTEGGKPRLLIQIYPAGQDLEKPLPDRPWKASPATRMMELLYAAEVRLGLITNGEHWMLVHARRGESTAFISWYATLWLEEPLTLRAFRSLLGAQRFFGVPDDQTLEALLAASAQEQHEVTNQLGYQVRQAVEILVQAIDRIDQDRGRTLLAGMDEARLYEAALTVMMRLVFLLAAEQRGLLLLGDPTYDQHYAVSTLRGQLREMADQYGEDVLERRFDAWSRLLATFRAVYGGIWHEDLRLPAYGGSLFDPDRFPFLEGRAPGTGWHTTPAQPLPINNRNVLHLLEALQILQVRVPGGGPAEARRLSFRALDIEQIGHVYEGLLDHIAVRAGEPVLGLAGTKDKEPELPLSELEAQQAKGEAALVEYLREQTGRSESALRRALASDEGPDSTHHASRLRAACGNAEALYQRVLSFAGLLRDDDYGFPVVVPAGAVYVTAGPTRRATGTHYTPRSLTEPIVQHTLEPLVYIGPAEGKPREEWRLRSPAELLDLKICDMAMGSGAFLVQACRYLSEGLVEAWDNVQSPNSKLQTPNSKLQITPEGKPATGDPGETLIPQDSEERLTLARRLVADRCLYGVDKNHLAVEMAKLSLWLITLAKDRPFSFLNHALRHGDSLIGADESMFLRWAQSLHGSAMPLFDEVLRQELETARQKRRELQSFEVRDVRDAERKAALLAEADAATARVKLGCDLLVGARLLDDLSQSEQEALLANALIDYVAGEPLEDENAQRALAAARRQPAFHWPFEFPEVFAKSGLSGFVGNPPFIGGRRIRETLGDDYREALYQLYPGSSGNADYCAFFFLRGYKHLHKGGTLGLIATNTIAQGDTRQTGLGKIMGEGAVIYNAINNQPWPGQAAVMVNVVHIAKGQLAPPYVLDGRPVQHISSLLDSRRVVGDPYRLAANRDKSFQGSVVVGMGFVLEPEEAQVLIAKDPRSRDVLFPYLNGLDLNSRPDQLPSRWIINFFDWPLRREAKGNWFSAGEKQQKEWMRSGIVPDDYPGPVAADYPDCLAIVREKVFPDRAKVRRKAHRVYWWHYGDKRPALYRTIEPLHRVLVIALTSRTAAFEFTPTNIVFAHAVGVIAYSEVHFFAILQSALHVEWAWRYGSSLKGDLRYTPSDIFETFPLPMSPIPNIESLVTIGETYHEHRHQLMLDRQEGLTQTYNRFHDPEESAADIVRLRELHVEMDRAVATAYGWDDLDLGHGFHETPQGVRFTISEAARREVLTRLLRLNHERYAEEVRQGLHEKKGGKPKKGAGKKAVNRNKTDDRQMSLF
jgi:hypothetical protein